MALLPIPPGTVFCRHCRYVIDQYDGVWTHGWNSSAHCMAWEGQVAEPLTRCTVPTRRTD